MRVAYVCADAGVPVFGRKGCSIHVQEVLRALRKQGADVTLFAARLGGDCPPDLQAIPVCLLPATPSGEPAERERASLAANAELRRKLELAPPFDLIYERYSLWSFSAMDYARRRDIPSLLEVNAPLIEEQARHRTLVDRAAAENTALRAFGAAVVVIAVSKEVAAYVEAFPAARGRVHVIPNGVNPDRFPGPPAAAPVDSESFTVGFVGTLKPWHGLPGLVEAFDRLYQDSPTWRLLIVGDGPEREELMADLASRGPDLPSAVRLTGAVAPDEIPPLLGSLDAAVAPYPDLSGFYFSPLKVYEYMAAGLPVIASRVGQLDGLIRDGLNGLLCPPGDAAALAAALQRLRHDPGLRDRLGRQARADVLARHTWDAVVRRILQLVGVRGQGSGFRVQESGVRDQGAWNRHSPLTTHQSGTR